MKVFWDGGKHDIFLSFVDDMIINGMQVVTLKGHELVELESVSKKHKLDFDDAYQYLVAKKHRLGLISFDKDFDKTDLKRKEPSEVIV